MFNAGLLLLHLPPAADVRPAEAETFDVFKLEGRLKGLPPQRTSGRCRTGRLQLGLPRVELRNLHSGRTFV